ncbi:MAG: endonuclease domain-containing protein [Pseudolabrys sp.]
MANRPTISQFKRDAARRLRHNATNAEEILWRHLRRLQTRGTHFRRQVPIGSYVVDFACMAARLVIEVDGSQHGEGEGQVRDRKRTQWLEAEGYRVLRFWNNDVTQNSRAVLDAIYGALYDDDVPSALSHERRRRDSETSKAHPTPARSARRPSSSRGG